MATQPHSFSGIFALLREIISTVAYDNNQDHQFDSSKHYEQIAKTKSNTFHINVFIFIKVTALIWNRTRDSRLIEFLSPQHRNDHRI